MQDKLQFTACYYSINRRTEKEVNNNFVVGAVLANLSKAFNCIPHDLLIVKLAAYDLSEETLMYILSYLSSCKECVRINNTVIFQI